MRSLLLYIMFAFFGAAHAQELPPAGSLIERTPVQSPEEEARSLSGTLKDLLGQVHEQLGRIDQELKAATTEKQNELLADQQEDLHEAKAELEKALERVNDGDRSNWTDIRSEVDELIRSVKEDLEEMRTSTSAVN